MSPLMACCCNPCTEDCPADGEGDPCELDSWSSSYDVSMSVSWQGTLGGSSTAASFSDDGETYNQVTSPSCHALSPDGTGGWGFRAVQWSSPVTAGFPANLYETDYEVAVGGGCNVSETYDDQLSRWGATNFGNLAEYSYAGLTLFHEFHCDTKFPLSIWYYVYNSYRIVPGISGCVTPIGFNAITASVLAYSTPSTTCNLAPDDALDWNLTVPTAGSLASRSKIITGERTGTNFERYVDMYWNCAVPDQTCDHVGGDAASINNINFSLQVT